MNKHPELWNMPWHARLKNLAEVAATSGEFCFRVVRAQSAVPAQSAVRMQSAVCAQSPVTSAGSWLGRALGRATPAHVSAR
jgi:hypothetical protein